MKSIITKGAEATLSKWSVNRIRSIVGSQKNLNSPYKPSSKLELEKRQYEYFNERTNHLQSEKHTDFHSFHFSPIADYNKASLYLLGNKAQIFGYMEDDYTSNDMLLNQVEHKNPNAIILGNMNYTDLLYLRKGEMKYQYAPKLELVEAEQTLARKRLSKFLNEDMHQSGRYFHEYPNKEDDYTIYELDNTHRRKIVRPQLSVAKYATTSHGKKLFYGQPNQLLVLEQVAARLSVEELRVIFDHCLQEYYDLMKQNSINCVYQPIDIHQNIVNIGMNLYDKSLYGEQIDYQATLLRKCTKLYKETVLVIHDLMVDKVKTAAMNADISEFDEIFTRKFNSLPKDTNLDHMLEKLAILTHLFSREFQLYLEYGQEHSLVTQLWNGKYKDEVGIRQRFYKVNQPYREKLQRLFDDDIKRLRDQPASGRSLIETYDKAMQRFDLKLKREYRFVANPLREIQQTLLLYGKMWEQIQENISRREKEGINQERTRVLLSQLMDDQAPPEALSLWKELVIEANTQMNLFTLPEELFGKYKEMMKITTYEHLKQMSGGLDPRKEFKKLVISQDNQFRRQTYTQLQDGSVPSFEQFQSIKEEIIKSNSGIEALQSPLKRDEIMESTAEQYLKLEQMAEDHPGAIDRIRKIQRQLNPDFLPEDLSQHQKSIFLDKAGNPVTETQMVPDSNAVYSPTGQPLPFDIHNKTVEELKKMGFKEVVSLNMQKDPVTKTLRPKMTPDERQRLKDAMKEMQKDENDPDYFVDTLGDDTKYNDFGEPIKTPKEEKFERMIEQQRKIDDARIAMVHIALEKGIPLQDELYMEMLSVYPFYQKKLQQRQNFIKHVKKQQEKLARGEKPILYKFEKLIKGRANLTPQRNVIDVESVEDEDAKLEEQIAKYDQILQDYEKDLEQIKVMGDNIGQDIISEDFAKRDIENNEREEIEIERRLGNKYLTKIEDDEGGSTIGEVNNKMQEPLLMKQFFEQSKELFKDENGKMNATQEDEDFAREHLRMKH